MRRGSGAAICLVLGLLAAAALEGQTASATLRGQIRDPQGAVVRGATITITVLATGFERRAVSGDDGHYVVTNLPPRTVDVRVGAPGFADVRREALPLEVGQTVVFDVELPLAGVAETLTIGGASGSAAVDAATSVVDAVIHARQIEALPLNGRNFLELALLAPGNAPAPNFDPTKSNSVAISSAGQLGRGGNIMIDGADNNDDVVGGPLQNVTVESVQEFQIATNRFTAEFGRSAASFINVVTKSGTNTLQGSASLFLRDDGWQGLPATFDRSSGERPPFDRQQISAAGGGPLVEGEAFWFGAVELRNQDGAILVGERDVAARAIRRSFAAAPLDDLLGSARFDWRPADADGFMFRYAAERADDVSGSTLDRAIGSASQRQDSENRFHSAVASWSRIWSPSLLSVTNVSFSTFRNTIAPVAAGPQLTFPSIQDGTSFRVPQGTDQTRFQIGETVSLVKGSHTIRAGGEWQRVDGRFDLDVFRSGRIELVEDFASFDHNGDGTVDDGDLLFAVTLRSGHPDQGLVIDDADNHHVAVFVQDDWRVRDDLTVGAGLRYELDTDVKNISRVDELNPLILPFLEGERGRDTNNFAPRVGFNWTPLRDRVSVHGGYGIYYDRVTLQIQSLERGLDGRALPIEVRAGNVFFLDPDTGQFPPFAPSIANPFTGFILTGAGASGINIIDNRLENPMVQQFNLGFQYALPYDVRLQVDGVHNLGTHFIIGRTIGEVFNPVVGGPDRVVNLESSVNTHYDALLVSAEKRSGANGFRASYAWSKAFNYANDDQIPFANGPIDPDNLRLEYGPTPNDQRHRFTLAAWGAAPAGVQLSAIWTLASAVPMDILMPDGAMRVPVFQRNAGGRIFDRGADLNRALTAINDAGGIDGLPLPLVRDEVRFGDPFNSVDLRVSRPFELGGVIVEPIAEVFNLFNVTNILGVSVRNYSGYSNVLVRDSADPADPGFLRSSSFGQPVTTAGGVFGSGGPRALQIAVRATF